MDKHGAFIDRRLKCSVWRHLYSIYKVLSMILIHNIIGIIGVTLIVGCYLLLQIERISSKDLAYSAGNALGAGLVLVSLWFDFNLSAAIVEVFWVAVSVLGMYRNWPNRKKKTIRNR